jgi:DNA-binding Xre family transcriptional regulator
MMLQVMAMEYKQKQLAAALGVSEATLSRMMPKGFAKDVPIWPSALASTEEQR